MNTAGMTAREVAAPGAGLRGARQARRMSQMDLALRVGVSQRHLSFIETGRAAPSRGMLLALLEALDVPLTQRNELLLQAGYAPEYGARDLRDTDLGAVREALQRLLDAHEPAPAIVIDAMWNLVLANRGAQRLHRLMSGEPTLAPPVNVLKRIFHPDGWRKLVANFDEVAAATWQRVQHEMLQHPPLAQLAHEVEPWVPPALRRPRYLQANHARPLAPVLTTRFKTPRGELTFFSAFTTFGTPQDITVASLRVEHFFPADAHTDRVCRDVAAETADEVAQR
ncbi:MAG TPA: helix-turn-helix transcriptional regulator [Burkholderiaceae bacterium]|nr:helix-turn-helix transcriptional regulator [Burkholderiaceae bacterium]